MFSQQNSVWIQCGPLFSARRGCDFWISLLLFEKSMDDNKKAWMNNYIKRSWKTQNLYSFTGKTKYWKNDDPHRTTKLKRRLWWRKCFNHSKVNLELCCLKKPSIPYKLYWKKKSWNWAKKKKKNFAKHNFVFIIKINWKKLNFTKQKKKSFFSLLIIQSYGITNWDYGDWNLWQVLYDKLSTESEEREFHEDDIKKVWHSIV